MREHSAMEVMELQRLNIKLDAENKAIKLRNNMLENIVKQAQDSSSRLNLNELSAFRIISE